MKSSASNSEKVVWRLETRLGRPVRVVWTENRCAFLSLRPREDYWVLRVDESFRLAPDPVWVGLDAFLATGQRHHLAAARSYFSRNRNSDRAPVRSTPVRPAGRVYDLEEVLQEVCDRSEFEEIPKAAISWGRRVRPGIRRVQLGSYQPGEPALIRVHPVLDDRLVPKFVVAQIVHHELVHHVITATRGLAEGRRHSPRFHRLEALFPDHGRALDWQERALGKLLARSRKR